MRSRLSARASMNMPNSVWSTLLARMKRTMTVSPALPASEKVLMPPPFTMAFMSDPLIASRTECALI